MSDYILVVDDHFGVRLLLYTILEEYGYSVKAVSSGLECLSLATSSNRPSLILLDERMPVMAGTEVLSQLVQDDRAKKIPVIMLSVEADLENVVRCFGVRKILTKPLDLNVLLKTIEETLADEKLG